MTYPRTHEKQAKVNRIIQNEVYCLQNEVVELILTLEENYDDICNYYYTPEGAEPDCPDSEEAHEVYQWFAVSDWLAEGLKQIGYPVLICKFGNWMGRISYGQALEMDSVWDNLLVLIEKRSEALNATE